MSNSTPDYNLNLLEEIKARNFKMLVTPRLKYMYINKDFERLSLDLLFTFLKEDSIFVDVGGHYGYYSLTASSKLRKGKIFTFEPVKENYFVLKKNILLNNYINTLERLYQTRNA